MTKGKVWGKKTWWILLVVLCVAIVVLAAGLMFLHRNNNKTDEPVVIYEDFVDLAESEVDSLKNPDAEQIIEIYQKYIDMASSPEQKADLLRARIISVQEIDLYYGGGELMISDAIAIDDILQNIESAVLVMNIASTYDDDILWEKYDEILKAREIDEGIDVNVETRG